MQMTTAKLPKQPVATADLAGTTVTLCMIVKDEEALLGKCLERAAGVWDELVVVDTGSQDNTVNIAKAAGAIVLERPWDHDFAAARNFGLAAARGDWVLYLDADEMLCDEVKEQIRLTTKNAGVGAATLVFRNRLPHGNVHLSNLLRLFRRFPDVTFRYPIHEEVWSSLEPCLRRSAKRVSALTGVVEHLGYQMERAQEKNKKERDVTLLRRCLGADPTDLYSWYKLLEVASFWKDDELLTGTVNAFRGHLPALGGYGLAGFPFAGELLSMMVQGLYKADANAALLFLSPWADRISPSAAYHLRMAELWESVGEPLRAAAEFCKCMALRDVTRDQQLASVRPLLGLSRLALMRGDLWEAWSHTENALKANPLDREALLSALLICREAAGRGGVGDFVKAYEAVHGATLELSATLSELAAMPGWLNPEPVAA
ncbi:MAG: glycosyltransferase family 2 protein [Deltaproteobacteria bacterium]|nr:glycosyltransferase family 2 protein [Deltaproteobacteria bacterium]